ncbi:MAG: hypothetical protein VBE63_29710 [Lamprobacter sp.]|uniref:hypothetical protein n=1 Tax=Lamprobacter sp. TaxID=3100796 RepID=UPI002B257581|nr:hypothetical protein [Lamprobacter sp.]MEA3644067.1 hypothetical protein [Lamprobacter sp.]
MSLKVLPLHTHWDAGEAYSVLAFIDELRDLIIAHYGDGITDMLNDAVTYQAEYQLELPFDDLPPF